MLNYSVAELRITFANASKNRHHNRPFAEDDAMRTDAYKHHIHTGKHRSEAMRTEGK